MNWEDSNNILNIGIIGAGFAAGVHSKALKSIDCSMRQYIFDVNDEIAKRFSDEYDCKAAKTLDDLFDSVDAVIIATPVWTHFDFVRKALEHNKHILCEKPMAQSYAEAKEMCGLSEITSVICAVGFNYRFFDITKSLQNEIKNTTVEEIHLSIRRLFRNDWRRDETSVLSDLGIHLIDLLSILSGGKIDVDCCKTQMKYINACDYESIVKGYTDNNIAFCLEAARIDNPKDVRFFVQIKCDRKIIKYDSRTMQIYSVTEGGKTQMKSLSNEINKEDFFDFYDSIMLQDKEWAAAIRGKNNFVVASFNDGYQSQIALDRILQLNDSR